MMALTILQPTADLIARKLQLVDNRSWSTPRRGPLAIHAGRSTVDLSAFDRERLPLGAIVALGWLLDCKPPDDLAHFPQLRDHQHVRGPYCLVIGHVYRLDSPIPARGENGSIWDWPRPDNLARDYFNAYPHLRPRSSTAQRLRGRPQ